MKTEVLILSSLYDFSTDLVCLRLQEASIPFLRLNKEKLKEYRISLDPLKPELTVKTGKKTYVIDNTLNAVWFRQPVFLRNTPEKALSPEEQLERSQWTAFIRSLSLFKAANWMNFPQNTYLAESKPYQLAMAKQSGFHVPQTIATNDAYQIKQFFPNDVVLKSLDTVLIHENDNCLFTYTDIGESNAVNDDNVSGTPLLAQKVLSNKKDIRITVIGNKLFAVEILANSEGIEGDWRVIPKNELDYIDIDLDQDTAKSCFKLTKTLGLNFAAIDLIVNPDGIYFIEVNPTGEWGWLTTKDRAIDYEIASWLSSSRKLSAREAS